MSFHTMLVVRDEGDVIEQALDHLLSWTDHLYVHDTGSLDGTWQAVLDRAARDDRVVPYRSEPIVFQRGVRSLLFAAYRDRIEPGDWCVLADADERYDVPPPEFVRSRVRRHEGQVHYQLRQFHYTESDLAAWVEGRETLADRARPIGERRLAHRALEYSERRMFRYRPGMQWPPDAWCPVNAGYAAVARVPISHYQYRDPVQMARRWAIRSWNARRRTQGVGSIRHWRVGSWRDWVVPDDAPGLVTCRPGEALVDRGLRGHARLGPRRAFERVAYATAAGLVDRARRPAGPYVPARVTDDEQRDLAASIEAAEAEALATSGSLAGHA